MVDMSNILLDNFLVKNLRAYPVLRRRFKAYVKGIDRLPQGFTKRKLFYDYIKVRRHNPEKRVSMSEYTIFGFHSLSLEEQKKYLTDTEATLLMRPYNAESEPYLKDKVAFLENFSDFVSREWLYLPDASREEFIDFVKRNGAVALKPKLSSWGIGFLKLTAQELEKIEDMDAFYQEMLDGKYLAEQFIQSDERLARFHPESLNTIRVISFRNGERFEIFGCGLRVGNKGLHVDNAHGGGIFCEIDPKTGLIITDGLDEHGNYYECHPMTGVRFKGEQIPCWQEIVDLCRRASMTLPCLKVVGWDVAVLPGGKLELIEGNHNPGMNIVQAPAKHGVHDKFANMLINFYGPPPEQPDTAKEHA